MPVCSKKSPLTSLVGTALQDGEREMVVVQMARLGDFLQTTPLLAALKMGNPGTRLRVLVSPAQAPLARACRFVDRALTLDPSHLEQAAASLEPDHLRLARIKGLTQSIWDQPADVVINLNLSLAAALTASGWIGARLRGWHWDYHAQALRGEDWTPYIMHLVADRRLTRLHLCDILASYAEPASPPLKRLDYGLGKNQHQQAEEMLPPKKPRVILQLGANNDLRRWPLNSFAGLARGLMDQGVSLVLVGSHGERVLSRRLKRELGAAGEEVYDLTGRTSLEMLAGVLAGCDLVVSSDTGTLHLATAVGATVLALYMGPAQAHETGPYGPGHLVLQARDQCGPCQEQNPRCRGEAPCRQLIDAGQALKAAQALLQGSNAAETGQLLDLPSGVEPLAGVMDHFGQRYESLRPKPLGVAQGLALALREAGRVLLRQAFQLIPETMNRELTREYLSPSREDAAQLAGLARAARQLEGAALNDDPGVAERTLGWAPGLRPLGALLGTKSPPRLAKACQAAFEVLTQAAER